MSQGPGDSCTSSEYWKRPLHQICPTILDLRTTAENGHFWRRERKTSSCSLGTSLHCSGQGCGWDHTPRDGREKQATKLIAVNWLKVKQNTDPLNSSVLWHSVVTMTAEKARQGQPRPRLRWRKSGLWPCFRSDGLLLRLARCCCLEPLCLGSWVAQSHQIQENET